MRRHAEVQWSVSALNGSVYAPGCAVPLLVRDYPIATATGDFQTRKLHVKRNKTRLSAQDQCMKAQAGFHVQKVAEYYLYMSEIDISPT
jgi:hypothetical protein